MAKSKAVIAVTGIVIILIAAFAIYAGETYPRTTVNTQVAFSIGADTKTTMFNQPFIDDKVQVQVTVNRPKPPRRETAAAYSLSRESHILLRHARRRSICPGLPSRAST